MFIENSKEKSTLFKTNPSNISLVELYLKRRELWQRDLYLLKMSIITNIWQLLFYNKYLESLWPGLLYTFMKHSKINPLFSSIIEHRETEVCFV